MFHKTLAISLILLVAPQLALASQGQGGGGRGNRNFRDKHLVFETAPDVVVTVFKTVHVTGGAGVGGEDEKPTGVRDGENEEPKKTGTAIRANTAKNTLQATVLGESDFGLVHPQADDELNGILRPTGTKVRTRTTAISNPNTVTNQGPKPTLGYHGTGCGPVDTDAKCEEVGSGSGTQGTLTVTFINKMGEDLAMSFGANDGSPGPIGMQTHSAILSSATPYIAEFETGWAGRVAVGYGYDSCGTKFEGSNIEFPDFDVSLVDGYTVPMVCSEDKLSNPPLRGCNIDLWKNAEDNNLQCSSSRDTDGKMCVNESRNPQGCDQPEEFFHACAQSAYVFPLDDCANVFKVSNTLVCCVGEDCPAAVSQPGEKARHNKRSTVLASEVNPLQTRKKSRRHAHVDQHGALAHHHGKV